MMHSLHRYSLLMLCCLASRVIPSIGELLEASTETAQGCSPAERDALLAFKSSIFDPSNRLASWNSQHDCCGWSGVVCRNDTTTARIHVVQLDLGNPDDYYPEKSLQGEKLSPSLLSLTHLESLNLSSNDFGGAQIPEFIGSFQKLRYLDLHGSYFSGTIPPQIGNLTSLLYLDLSFDYYTQVQSLDWLVHLRTLTYLDMSWLDLSAVSHNWLSTVNMLPSLQELRLFSCGLDQIPSSLSHVNLTSLATLGLSSNNFNTTLPSWLSQLTSLSYLYLEYNNFYGTIIAGIGNLSSLTKLQIPDNSLSGPLPNGIWSLTHLTELNLGNNLLGGHIPIGIGNLTSLTDLSLSECTLGGPIPTEIGNLTSLTKLDLSKNSLSGPIPTEMGDLTSLTKLDLSINSLSGPIPTEMGNLTSLTNLDLSKNSLSGPIPTEMGNLTSLTKLDLSINSLNGSIPAEIGNLISLIELHLRTNSLSSLPVEIGKLLSLTSLDLSSNSLKGVISQLHFANLINLQQLDLSNNFLLTINQNLVVPFQLQFLTLTSLKLGPTFPMWLRLQNSIKGLNLSNTSIEGNLPNWFWTSFFTYRAIDLSYNKIRGTLPLSLESFTKLAFLNLRSNLLEGPIPKFSMNIKVMDLSINSLSGPLPLNFSSWVYILSHNQIYGRIPHSICNSTLLILLDLSYNQIFGEIPHCEWLDRSNLKVFHLGNNNLSGKIPSSIGQLKYITSLQLKNNNLYGQIPSSLQNCTQLRVLDLSYNKFSGNIPIWIGQRLQKLIILRLRSNMFSGHIFLHIEQLNKLQIIDLANNYLTGSIPHSLGNLSAMISRSRAKVHLGYSIRTAAAASFTITEMENITIITKGSEYSFSKILSFVKSIDLSNNNLVGEIPTELGFLAGLQTLNLSRNHLKGNIPSTIDGMKSLETLDLSYNMLSGAIPQGLSALNSLNHLNLSYNNLFGMIPEGHQLQTLEDASIYKGNAYLCGALLNKSCSGHGNNTAIYEDHEGSSNMVSIYLSTTLGFLFGLWSVFVIILFKKEWRNYYFMMIDKTYDKFYVQIKIRLGKYFSTN